MERINKITKPDFKAMELSQCKWNSVAKPIRSLGLLEKFITKIAGITGNEEVKINKRCTVVMCADNGVVTEGVTQSDSSVTALVAESIANGKANINLISKPYNIDVIAVDIGMKTDVDDEKIIRRKKSYGTENISRGNAMTVSQAEYAILAGIDIVKDLKSKGYDILITGEMGIGNTTTASAIASVILGEPVRNVTGCGAGLDEKRLEHKIHVIERAIKVNDPIKSKPVELLSKIGGFDIAGMTGLFLGGAVYRVPVV
ncbi:MAG: nicotinate-nucleotide--dimethylbenzimidazole phosphoribosyltransferase, partial [Oscillospiraceae bacterium]|nr:nicotinate-nucleotide--dimethylbenzimidazole phosphoribosyltransferase [Oscillospiraceae bacterium]